MFLYQERKMRLTLVVGESTESLKAHPWFDPVAHLTPRTLTDSNPSQVAILSATPTCQALPCLPAFISSLSLELFLHPSSYLFKMVQKQRCTASSVVGCRESLSNGFWKTKLCRSNFYTSFRSQTLRSSLCPLSLTPQSFSEVSPSNFSSCKRRSSSSCP